MTTQELLAHAVQVRMNLAKALSDPPSGDELLLLIAQVGGAMAKMANTITDQGNTLDAIGMKLTEAWVPEADRILPVLDMIEGRTTVTVYPEAMTPALSEVLGLHPGTAIALSSVLRATGTPMAQRYEAENAAVRHFLIPLALEFPETWREESANILDVRIKAMKASAPA